MSANGPGNGLDARRDQSRYVRHIDHEQSAHIVGYGSQSLEVDYAGIGARPGDQKDRLEQLSLQSYRIVIQLFPTFRLPHTSRNCTACPKN